MRFSPAQTSPRVAQASAIINNIATSKPLDQSIHHQFHQSRPHFYIFHQISRRITLPNICASSRAPFSVFNAPCVASSPLTRIDRGVINNSPARHRNRRYGCHTKENHLKRERRGCQIRLRRLFIRYYIHCRYFWLLPGHCLETSKRASGISRLNLMGRHDGVANHVGGYIGPHSMCRRSL